MGAAWRTGQEPVRLGSSASTAALAWSQRRAANCAASAASCSRAKAAANRSWEGGGNTGQLSAAR